MADSDRITRAREAADQIDEAADQIDEAARSLGEADVMLSDPDFDQPEVERQLLQALKLTLNALAVLRRKP
jgi:hypothetical protein